MSWSMSSVVTWMVVGLPLRSMVSNSSSVRRWLSSVDRLRPVSVASSLAVMVSVPLRAVRMSQRVSLALGLCSQW